MILHQLVYTLPELSLLMGIVHLGILYMLSYESARLYARVSRFWLLASIFWNIVFYDKTFSPLYFANDAYTLLFSLLAGFLAYIMLGLSSAWFSVENRTGCRYYVLVLCALIGIDLLLAASNLVALLFCYILLIFINYRLLGISYEKLPSEAAVRYMGVSAVIVLIFAAGFGFLNYIQDGAVDFSELYALFPEIRLLCLCFGGGGNCRPLFIFAWHCAVSYNGGRQGRQGDTAGQPLLCLGCARCAVGSIY